MLVWHFDASGEYSVKSGYRALLTTHRYPSDYNMEPIASYKQFYNLLWELQIPAKLKIHMWRLSKDFVPHFNNLLKRRLQVVNVCPLCKEAPEDLGHLLWSCDVLRHLWLSLNLPFDCSVRTLDGKNQLMNIFIKVDADTRKLLVISLWATWFQRNKVVHEGTQFVWQDLVGFVKRLCFCFKCE